MTEMFRRFGSGSAKSSSVKSAKAYAKHWRWMQDAPLMRSPSDAALVSAHLQRVLDASRGVAMTNTHRAQLASEAQRIWMQRHAQRPTQRPTQRQPAQLRPSASSQPSAVNKLVREAALSVARNRARAARQNSELRGLRRRFAALKGL